MSLKMKMQNFKKAIQCGTGDAYLILQQNPDINFTSLILDAAKNNYAYDTQAEGNRAEYLYKLIEICPQKETIITKVIEALNVENNDVWNIDQLFALNAIFAKNGNKKAKKAIYKRYKKNYLESSWLGQEEIALLDRLDGLKVIAKRRGKSLFKNKNDWEDSFFIEWFQEEFPDIKVLKELKKLSKDNKYIEKYYATILKSKEAELKRKKHPKTTYTYTEVTKQIQQSKSPPISLRGINDLSPSDLKKLAKDFVSESDISKQEKYLWIFYRREYPLGDYKPLLKIAKGSTKKNFKLVKYACYSLQYCKGKDIRRFALEKLKKTNKPWLYLYLLVSNYKKGDDELISTIINKYNNQDDIHELIFGINAIYSANKVKECKIPLELMYRKMTCGIHRYELLQILVKNQSLSKEILQEMEFDSYEDIRKMYKNLQHIE